MAAQINIVDARSRLADTINRVTAGGERVVLERRGKGVAALVSMQDLELLEAMEDQRDLRAARRARREKGSVPISQIKARLGMR
jgi:prevent-host-death family protein